MFTNYGFIEFVRWAIYTIAKFVLSQMNNINGICLGLTEFVYVPKRLNELIKLTNFSLKKDPEFLESSGVITPHIMNSWIKDPDMVLSTIKEAGPISPIVRANFLRPSIEGDNLLITAEKMKLLKLHLENIINAYKEIGEIEAVTVAENYILNVSYCDINLPNQYELAESILMGEYDDYYPIDLGTATWILTGAELKARGLL